MKPNKILGIEISKKHLENILRNNNIDKLNSDIKHIEEYLDKNNYQVKHLFETGALSLVLKVTKDKESYILKYTQAKELLENEEEFLKKLNKVNLTPKIIEYNRELHFILMEYLEETNQQPTIEEIIELSQEISKHSIKTKNTVKDNIEMRCKWLENDLIKTNKTQHIKELNQHKNALFHIINHNNEQYLNHGDFQNKNLIKTKRCLKTIDPIPCYGLKYYDLALWTIWHQRQKRVNLIEKIEDKINCDYFKGLVEHLSYIEQNARDL